jgi:hypothetical protein
MIFNAELQPVYVHYSTLNEGITAIVPTTYGNPEQKMRNNMRIQQTPKQ